MRKVLVIVAASVLVVTGFAVSAEGLAASQKGPVEDVKSVKQAAKPKDVFSTSTDRLAEASNDKIISEVDKQKIEAKIREIKSLQEDFYANKVNQMSSDERVAYIKTQNENVRQWEFENNIPSGYLSFVFDYSGAK